MALAESFTPDCAVAVDVMSGDHGMRSNLEAVMKVAAHKANQRVLFYVVGGEINIHSIGGDRLHDLKNVKVIDCTDTIGMHESPKGALRRKTTISTCLNLVKEGLAGSCLSSGNTGALMMLSHVILKTIKGIDRVAICASIPNIKGSTYFLDLGANASCRPIHLLQFAIMASILYQTQEVNPNPKIGLLNIGSEGAKGNNHIKETAALFEKCNLINYIGFVEGYNLYDGSVDIVVTDGFTGNVALKSSEGVAMFVKNLMQFRLNDWRHNLLLLPAIPFLFHLKREIDPRRYNGASFLGLNGSVLKSHGNADTYGFMHSLNRCIAQSRGNLHHKISEKIKLASKDI